MLSDRQLKAWHGLGIGPAWTIRAAAVGASEAAAHDLSLAGHENDRLVRWSALAAQVEACRACALGSTRQHSVFGSGALSAQWLLVGEAPGAEEDREGEPFVGRAGELLDSILRAVGIDRGRDVIITNVLKCRPPGNRNPEPQEVDRCESHLWAQIGLLEPRLVVVMGRFAAQSLLKTEASIASLRGRVHQLMVRDRALPAVVTYHPAYLLRNPADKAKAWEDWCLARSTMQAPQASST